MMTLKMNYNAWFYNQYKYRTSKRNDIESFTDTKWVDIHNRLRTLQEMQSDLLTEQPTLVQGNNKGFDMLLDLMARSNYTFEDLDKSLVETFRTSLQNAMGYNLVNTHAVMFHTDNHDSKNVTAEKFTHYKIIDAPFNQLHFGHRDEFIRQKIHEMHITENDYYIDIDKFNTSNISDVLDFCILCTVNGHISNDCKVAIDDHGFKFKIGWKSNDDVDFIIYKLDKAKVHKVHMSVPNDMSVIPYENLGLEKNRVNGSKCIINIYNESYKTVIPTVPNFGVFTDKGLEIRGLQYATSSMITNNGMNDIDLTIYILKYFHEVPNVFPAVNYYDIMESKLVYDEKYEKLRTPDGSLVVESTYTESNNLETCTPPITIDRDTSYTFDTIVKCLTLKDTLMSFKETLTNVGTFINSSDGDMYTYDRTLRPELYHVYADMSVALSSYKRGAIITSLVPAEDIRVFDKLYDNVKRLYNEFRDFEDASKFYDFQELYGNNYDYTVNKICRPFMNEKLKQFTKATDIASNFFDIESSTRFTRPISEQCFISMKYSEEEQSWLFAYPKINHFHGIGNTFYVNENLTGKEIFKFFILYTDTMDPANKYIEHFDLNTTIDFDLFYDEMCKYNGCIRYWDAESRLAKISKILYRKYNDETCIHVLSKILKRKIDGEEIINMYPSDINYDAANVTSDNVENYDEDSYRGPFSINFLFYTLSLLNDNVDKLQAYFYRTLTANKFSNRYTDVDVSSVIGSDEMFPMSYSQYTISPATFPDDMISPIGAQSLAFYGLPLLTNGSGTTNLCDPYRFVLNVYDENVKFPLITEKGLDNEYFVQYSDITEYNGVLVSYKDTIELTRLLTKYIDCIYDYISKLQTNYQKSYNVTLICDNAISSLDAIRAEIMTLVENGNIVDIEVDGIHTDDVIDVVNYEAFQNRMIALKGLCNQINEIFYNNSSDIVGFINRELIYVLKYVYVMFGFDDNVNDRVRALYDHLRKINHPMNPYVFKKWLGEIDLHILETLDQHVAANENNVYADNLFKDLHDALAAYVERVTPVLSILSFNISDLSQSFYTSYTSKLVKFCGKVIDDVVFDIFTISSVDVDFSASSYSANPMYLTIPMPNDAHVVAPFGPSIPGNHNLIFKLDTYVDNDRYKISSMSNICEYVFFNGESLSNITATVLSESGSSLGTITCGINFIRAGSTADKGDEFNLLPNIGTTTIDFENHHETFEVVDDKVVNEKCADMNYELLVGNHFDLLDHVSEYILNPTTWNPGSIDRIILDNQVVNRMSILDHGHNECIKVFFKPSQIFHSVPVNGKYFEGEKVYAKLTDGSYIFPIKVTTVSHSIEKGFVEAEVDDWNSTWLQISDKEKIHDFLFDTVECEVIDDSIRNFMDEYSDGDYKSFYNPGYNNESYVMDDKYESCYSLPGDPIYVTSNAPFVYTRLNWMFNEDVPNRFIDEEHKQYRFIYIGEGFINDADGIKINMINHDFNNKTLPEKYPILKNEPNDHLVRRAEVTKFNQVIEDNMAMIIGSDDYEGIRPRIAKLQERYDNEEDYYERKKIFGEISDLEIKEKMCENTIARMKELLFQPEGMTTWYNVGSHDAALVYIDNGRAEKFSPIFVSNIRDICYDDKMNVFLYDWENKHWVDPSTYTITYEIVDGVKIDERDNYTTDNVMTSMTIVPTNEFVSSKKLLVYFGYDKSDIYDDIEMNPKTFEVRFKPLIVLDSPEKNYNPYYGVKIRKHFDGYEKYSTTTNENGEIIIKRIKRSGKFNYAPVFRLCDVSVHDGNGDHDYTDIIELKVKSPFNGFTTTRKLHKLAYTTTINAPIDSFSPDQTVKLICISNNENNSYDGNISTVMFEGTTSLNGSDQVIIIDKSSLSNYESGTFICTVLKDDKYDPVGGVITIQVTSTTEDIYGDWVTVPAEYMDTRELPDEFMIKVTNASPDSDVTVILENKYIKNMDDTIYEDNHSIYNPYEYYYDTHNKKRIPISDVRTNSHNKRLVVDTNENPNIELIKSTYMGICRYSLAHIPTDGIINMTGYLPTPLSRDRYEFWVNGRCISGTKDLIILSPTSIQLCNMKSLRNFECIELIDDVDNDNDLMHKGPVYIDINGNTYGNYKLAMLSNSKINKQDLTFIFNANNHEKINDYSKGIVDPNNHDTEVDILSTITFDDSDADYNKLTNIPSINGVSLFHTKLDSIGLSEIDNMDIIKAFDKVWKHEAATDPFFINTHRCDTNITNDKSGSVIHIKKITEPDWHGLDIDTTNMFVIHVTGPIDKYFSLYVSNLEDGVIDDVHNTLKIIPFVSSSVYILLDSSYNGLWLHSTYPNTDPIHII